METAKGPRRTVALLAVFVLGAPISVIVSPASAAPAAKPPAKDCMKTAVTTPELTACAASEAANADRRLNAAYKELMRYLDKDEQAKLVKAQRAWIVFRDADCAFFSAGGGSLAPMNNLLCRADLSTTRAHELDNWPPNAERSALGPLR